MPSKLKLLIPEAVFFAFPDDHNVQNYLVSIQEDGSVLPIVCLHGGSGYYCAKCARESWAKQKQEEKINPWFLNLEFIKTHNCSEEEIFKGKIKHLLNSGYSFSFAKGQISICLQVLDPTVIQIGLDASEKEISEFIDSIITKKPSSILMIKSVLESHLK